MIISKAAREYEPTGDPEHIAYGQEYYWQCSCGKTAGFLTKEHKARNRGKRHEKYCDGTVTVTVRE